MFVSDTTLLYYDNYFELDFGVAGGIIAGINGSGTLAVITFRALGVGVADVGIGWVNLRDTANQEIEIDYSRTSDGKVFINTN